MSGSGNEMVTENEEFKLLRQFTTGAFEYPSICGSPKSTSM